MRVYEMLVDERLGMADLLASLTDDQLRQPSLCTGWTVHDIAAHLVSYLRFGQAKLYLGIVLTGADIDRVNVNLTRWLARRPTDLLIRQLRQRASSRVTIPRSGYDPVLADIVLHEMDVRRPLGVDRDMPEERLWVTFNHLTRKPSPGYTMGSRLDGLRVEAEDTGWWHGDGPVVRGDAQALLLAISGRTAALDEVTGDGVPMLRERLLSRTKGGPAQRIGTVLNVLTSPQPRERRSRQAVGFSNPGGHDRGA
jgi:uncharacterized protein (TIGR03083 family)